MDTKLVVGIACMVPALLAGLVLLANWAWRNPSDFIEALIGFGIVVMVLAALVGLCLIAAVWWPWWALPAALAALFTMAFLATVLD